MRQFTWIMLVAGCLGLVGCDSEFANKLPGMNPWLDGNPGQFLSFSGNAEKGPVVMLNLLKFNETSLDGNGTGAEAYARYGELAGPFVEKHGGKLIWMGAATETLVGDIAYDWDMVLLVQWPARQNLLDLADDEDYKAISHHRTNGLERTMLIALDEQMSILNSN